MADDDEEKEDDEAREMDDREVEEHDADDWSEAMTENPSGRETSKNNSVLEVSSTKISETQLPENNISLQVTNSAGKNVDDKNDKKPETPNPQRQPRSECRARSRNTRQCQKHFQGMIEKHGIRNEELEQREGDLRQRLETLECSMPAVMVWNIWRMAQGAPNSAVCRLMEKQFQGYAADKTAVPTTPSQHWDDRVRKIEAERKEASRRAEEARALLAEKEAAVNVRRKRLEEAKKCNQERKEKMEKLAQEVADLREALKNARGDGNSCETGECGEIRCKEKWLEDVGSVSSIGSADIECFANLQELAEAEICMKRQINELERREEAYMRTLQQADEMWSKMEGDTADTVSELQDQLDAKTSANQQLADRICELEDKLESLKKKLINCRGTLSEYTGKEYSDVSIGLNNGEATVKDRAVAAAVKTATAYATAAPMTADQDSLTYPETIDEESSTVEPEYNDASLNAIPKTFHKSSEVIPVADQIHRGIDPVTGLGIDAGVGDEKDTPEHWNNVNWDEGCPSDIICDGQVESSMETDEFVQKGVPTTESEVQAIPEIIEQPEGGNEAEDMANFAGDVQIFRTDATDQTNDPPPTTKSTTTTMDAAKMSVPDSNQITLSREELRNWYNIVDSVHHMIAKSADCSSKTDDVAQLAEKMQSHLRIKSLAGVKGPMIMEELLKEQEIPSEERRPGSLTSSTGEMPQKIKSAVLIDRVDLPDEKKLISPEAEEDVEFPEGTTEATDISVKPVITDVETDPLELLEKIPDAPKSETEVTETQPADAASDSMVPIPKEVEVESEELAETPKKLSATESLLASAEDFAQIESATSALAVELKESLRIPEDDTMIETPKESAEEAEEIISVSKEDKLEFEDTAEPPEQPLVVPIENEELKSDASDEKDAIVEESETKEGKLSATDLKNKLESGLDIISTIPSSEMITDKVLEALLSPKENAPDDTGEMPELIESDIASIIISIENEERSTIIEGEESSQLEATISEAQLGDVKADSKTKMKIPEARSHSDVKEIEGPVDKTAEDISSEGKVIMVPDRAKVGKPYLAIAKVESWGKLELSKPEGLCICKRRTCPLLGRRTDRQLKLNVPRVATEGTEATSLICKTSQERMDKPKLKTITESTCPSPEAGLWRRATIWSRHPRDKSTLTMVCVDTQTDSALIRERIALEGITRKDDCTCSGACPRKTEHSGCIQQILNRPLGEKRSAPVSLAVGDIFGSAKFPKSVTSSAKKEKTEARYTGKSLVPQDSECHCVECGRPITPEGTLLSTKFTLASSSKSRKSVMSSLMQMTSSISRGNCEKKDFTCCECKTSGKLKTVDRSGYKRENNKDLNKNNCNQDVGCGCPSGITKKAFNKSSKKKRKPETKDQATMTNIPRSTGKVCPKETKGVYISKTKPKDDEVKMESKGLSSDQVSYCECEESSHEASIAGRDSAGDHTLSETPKENLACDCFLRESVSKGSSCNCTESTN